MDLSLLIKELTSVRDSIEASANYFEILNKHIKFKKGAFLLYDYNYKVYAPWSLAGFDKTTGFRLRFPNNFVNEHKTFLRSAISIFNEDLLIVQPFFSTREFSMIERIFVCPFYNDDNIFAFFIFTETEAMKNNKDYIESILNDISEFLSPILFLSREDKFRGLAETLQPSDTAKEVFSELDIIKESDTFQEILAERKEEGFYIKLNFMNLINHVTVSTPLSDPFRIRQDIKRILTSMVSESGKVFYIDQNTFLILTSSGSIRNEQLLIHQINFAMHNFFKDLEDFPDPDHVIRRFPQDGESSVEILEGFL